MFIGVLMLFCRTCKNKRIEATKTEGTRNNETITSETDQQRNLSGDNRSHRNVSPMPSAPPAHPSNVMSQRLYPSGPPPGQLPSYDECRY